MGSPTIRYAAWFAVGAAAGLIAETAAAYLFLCWGLDANWLVEENDD